MNTQERFRAAMSFEPFDRLPVIEWASWWDKTIQRWHGEGLPASVTDKYEICEHFGLDLYYQQWLSTRRAGCPQPVSHGAGIIADEADYERIRPYLYPDQPLGIDAWRHWARRRQDGQAVLWFTVEGFFWFPRTLLGIERHLYAFYDQPELMHRINSDLADWMLRAFEQVAAVAPADFMTFAEDMSYNHGPMLSKELFDEFCLPYYRRVIPALNAAGTLAITDSDGDISAAAPWFASAGLDGVLPLERQAGVDIARLRGDNPRMRFIGHFDKMVMHHGEAALRAEFERLVPTAAGGGFLISCDHQTPPGVSLEDYQLYLSLFREYAAEAGRLSRQPGKAGVR